jgi:hypothetical protein
VPVDFKKPAHILVVHGVQTGEDKDIEAAQQIRTLVTRSLSDCYMEKDFVVKGYLYENINDNAQNFYKKIGSALTRSSPLAGKALKTFIDLVGDVVIAAKNNSTAHEIRQGLREEIMKSYRSKNQLIVVAHSLGTIYALDVINELIGSKRYFKGDKYNTWPVQGLVTLGSPLGLGLEIGGLKIFEKCQINSLRDAEFSRFSWHNFYNRLDPIVSGNIFGAPVDIDGSKGPVEMRYGPSILASNWRLRGHVVTSGQQWLLAHVAYWNNPTIGDTLVDML